MTETKEKTTTANINTKNFSYGRNYYDNATLESFLMGLAEKYGLDPVMTASSIRAWWQELPESKEMPLEKFMELQKEQDIYDYGKALSSGMLPSLTEHGDYRWPDLGKLQENPNLDNTE